MRRETDNAAAIRVEDARNRPTTGVYLVEVQSGSESAARKPVERTDFNGTTPAIRTQCRLSTPVRPLCAPTNADPAPVSIELSPFERAAIVQGRAVALTPLQFHLLAYFLRNAGRVIPFDEFTASVFQTAEAPDSSKLRVHIHALRRRLGPSGKCIVSVRGKGYGIVLNGS